MLQARAKSDYNYSYNNNKENKPISNKKELSNTGVIIFLLAIIFVGTILVSYICQFVQIAHLSYEINKLEEHIDIIKDENYILNIKLAEKKSMAKIEKIARNNLHMVEPDTVEIVVLNNKVKQIDTLPKDTQDKVFYVKVFNNLMERIGTVKAKELD